jgi:DNA primase
VDNKRCLICSRPRDTLYWHIDDDNGNIWVYCTGRCQRGYSLFEYVHLAGIELSEFLKGDFEFNETKPNEVNKLDWPSNFIPLSDPRAKKGVEYIKSRGLNLRGDMYYDMERSAIVFPYYYGSVFVGAQTRLLTSWINEEGEETKILTMPGTRLGLVFYNWNQEPFMTDVKGVVICEGAFNVLAIQQSLDKLYGSTLKNPWKVVATSGCGTTTHQLEKIKELKDAGIKIVVAFDSDEAGIKGLKKFINEDAATHYALVEDMSKDWNDMLKDMGNDFANYFMSRVTPVSSLD